MPITRIPSNDIVATKPRIAGLTQVGATTGTYYTVVDVTGRGKVNLCTAHAYTASVLFTNLHIRITIDGVANTLQGTNPALVGYFPNTGTNSTSFNYFTELNFISSFKMEIMQNAGTYDLYGYAQYALE